MSELDFWSEEERALCNRFLDEGYIVAPSEDPSALNRIRSLVVEAASDWLGVPPAEDQTAFLDGVAERVPVDKLNDFRLHIINAMNAAPWLRAAYYRIARQTLGVVIGNELCMQRRVNLSIQLPHDDSSLLPVHGDTWSGDSPFEAVLWIPLVDCRQTKSMYLSPPAATSRMHREMSKYAEKGVEALYQDYQDEFIWMDVPYGNFLLFNQNLPHGNRINQEAGARWSMNCRFKGVFTPYADKKLGEFFEPITLRPISQIGLDYEYPAGFGRAEQ